MAARYAADPRAIEVGMLLPLFLSIEWYFGKRLRQAIRAVLQMPVTLECRERLPHHVEYRLVRRSTFRVAMPAIVIRMPCGEQLD